MERLIPALLLQTRGVLKKAADGPLYKRADAPCEGGRRPRTDRDTYSTRSSSASEPLEAEDGAVPGHWEGDLRTGASDTHIVMLVEATAPRAMLSALQGKLRRLWWLARPQASGNRPRSQRCSLTWDQGKETPRHKRFHGLNQRAGSSLCIRGVHGSVAGMRT